MNPSAEFQSITNGTPEEAKFFLDANNGDVQTAVNSFFNSRDTLQNTSSSSSSSKTKNEKPDPKSRIVSMKDIINSSKNDEEDDEEGQNLYAGGEKSGIFMKSGSGKKKEDAPNLVKDILQIAKETGGKPKEEDDSSKKKKAHNFGQGFKLGADDGGSSSTTHDPIIPSESEEPVQEVNGFTINDGPLLDYNDPKNKSFLESIKMGRAPLDFLDVKFGQHVELKVQQNMEEDYKEPKNKPLKPFSGTGNRLGAPVVSSSHNANLPGSFPSSSVTREPDIEKAKSSYSVDESLPTTSIQLRLGDGTRMVARFNHTHHVSDLRQFVNLSRPGESQRNYVFMTAFPNKQISDETLNLKEANLLNASLIQKYV
ncbi:hypothetical protein HK099_005136 [Clydaea vesicula]|uniref:NSFL1 cofactor p47 n=1 Tax=Clydaea vesicula TaxID=447962 RepID=A0AAD5U6J5_9FUNG|nr:hypothetical protein HK099_005136 [Clydaea vesicula]